MQMSGWRDRLHGDPLPWLLEEDESQPAVRYFALRDLVGKPETDREARAAKKAIMVTGPVPAILSAQNKAGYWGDPTVVYEKYTGTVNQVTFLAQLGADGADPRVRAACEYVLSRYICDNGGFSITALPSKFIHCYAGNLEAALVDFG
jgi:hypothetical protein